MADADKGLNHKACEGFRAAENNYIGAQYTLLEHGTANDADIDYVYGNTAILNERIKDAQENASNVCGLNDE